MVLVKMLQWILMHAGLSAVYLYQDHSISRLLCILSIVKMGADI